MQRLCSIVKQGILGQRGTYHGSKCASLGGMRVGRGVNRPLCHYLGPDDSEAGLAPWKRHNALVASPGQDIDRWIDCCVALRAGQDCCNLLILEDLDVPFE
jgi:hypothetical protein